MNSNFWFIVAFFVLLSSILMGITIGAYNISINQIIDVVLNTNNKTNNNLNASILMDIRLPRVFLALFVGAALAISGAALQGLFRNPLVDSGIIGTSTGASFGAALFLTFSTILPLFEGFFKELSISFSAFIGALVTTLIVLRISKNKNGISTTILILAGISINAIVNSLTGILIYFADDEQLRDITFWSLGSLGGSNWRAVLIIFPIIVMGFMYILFRAKDLNALNLGEQAAYYMGVPVKKTKKTILVAITVMVGSCVSFVGIIGFIGLIVPHISRFIIGNDNRKVIPFSAILGGILLILSDLFSRTIMAPTELPIGIVTSFLGGPFFIYLIVKNKKTLM